MAGYIDREATKSAFQNMDAGRKVGSTLLSPEEFAEYLDEFPAADVAPVVRCMDCKHLVSVNVNGKGIPTCRVSGMEVAPDEFCSRGEKGRR